MYYTWKETALTRVERNIKKMWVADLLNVNLFLVRIREKDETIKPTSFFYDSAGYFEYLFLWKIVKEIELLRLRHFLKPKRHKKILAKPRKTIRLLFYFLEFSI